MTTRVLVVDDSGFIRRRIVQILNLEPEIEVVGTAVNGKEAVSKAVELSPDVITMDVEMPVMDGITAVKEIMHKRPCSILMFSASTQAGAKSTLDALEAGAIDFLPKELSQIDGDREKAEELLRTRVLKIGRNSALLKHRKLKPSCTQVSRKAKLSPIHTLRAHLSPIKSTSSPRLLVIAASTGGPVAIQKVLMELPKNFPLPILLIQHMPANFTPSFAERLDRLCDVEVKEAEEGDMLKPGVAFLAPGGKQMLLKKCGSRVSIEIRDSRSGESYQPCVDTTFESVAPLFPGKILAVVLTGMGADGREGARKLKNSGSTVWTQDEQSCTVYGMPKAIADAGLTDNVVVLDNMGQALAGLNG
jgi:two-component system chemotaxis response regulator CheB